MRTTISDKFYSPVITLTAELVFRITLFLIILFNCFFSKLKIIGRENLKGIKGGFLVSNHILYLDSAVIAHTVAPRRAFFTAKEETFQIPVLGTYIRCLGAFPVSEQMSILKLEEEVKALIEKKYFVHFFPEGELSHLSDKVHPFKGGVFYLALLLNKPVVPLSITAQPRRWLNSRLNKCFCRVKILVGKPVYPDGFRNPENKLKRNIQEFTDYTRQMIIRGVEELKQDSFPGPG